MSFLVVPLEFYTYKTIAIQCEWELESALHDVLLKRLHIVKQAVVAVVTANSISNNNGQIKWQCNFPIVCGRPHNSTNKQC